MDVKMEDAGPCRKLMHVATTVDEVREDYEELLSWFRKGGRVPGFRKGKAPTKVIEAQYRKDLTESAKERLVPRFYREALEEQGITPVAIVGIQDVEFAKDTGLAFDVMIDVPPEFKLPKYMKISVKRNAVEVSDDDVQKAFDSVLEQQSRFEDDDEGTLEDGNLVKLDYSGVCGEQPVKELAPDAPELDDGKDFWAMLGQREFLPGVDASLLGAKVGDEVKAEITFPEDFATEALRGRTASYTLTIKARRARKLPEVNEEFLKMFEVDSEDALRQRIRDDIQQNGEQQEQSRLKSEIGNHLLKKAKFDLPQSLVQQEMEMMVRSMVERIAMQGASREQLEQQQAQIVESATEASKERVQLTYILSRIADKESITVSDEEVDQRLATMAAGYGMTADKLKSELEKRNALERLQSDIRDEKTLDFLLENAKVK
ncbi:MAG: trigger factor [Kiritimatiellia bacterium]|jgi:trigger factor|nr:trigger factor [Kiritimatiellia bacterium]MDP6629898.1 trigger factor [Kiritimatiellia bacterium]MDP6810566.1 trigger factor [Kiritimatiellia bacterium]MDP7022847.1 trigger factor [Kiritimatiellia bacterium]